MLATVWNLEFPVHYLLFGQLVCPTLGTRRRASCPKKAQWLADPERPPTSRHFLFRPTMTWKVKERSPLFRPILPAITKNLFNEGVCVRVWHGASRKVISKHCYTYTIHTNHSGAELFLSLVVVPSRKFKWSRFRDRCYGIYLTARCCELPYTCSYIRWMLVGKYISKG